MDWLTILHLPNYERIVLTYASEEFVIWTELQFQNLLLYTSKDSHRPASLHIPEDYGRIWNSLEHGTFLACGDYVTRIGDG